MTFRRLVRNFSAAAVTAAALSCLSVSSIQAAGLPHPLPPQPLADALETFARSVGLQLVYGPEITVGVRSPGAAAGLQPDETLRELLRGTGLTFEFVNESTVTILRSGRAVVSGAAQNGDADAGGSEPAQRASMFRLVQAATNDQASPAAQEFSGNSGRATDKTTGQEMVVTGSHIRGAGNSSSPVYMYDKEEIRKSGFANTQEFIRSLPQTFGGGMADTSMGAILGGEGSNYNFANASAANLRGLGNRGTLTLLNGRRVAPASIGDGVDLSMIPLNAVERIDVLTDGASAIYGSDAVGGVVNIILRKGYDGAETSLRYGAVTSGSHEEKELSQTLGHSWGAGDAILSYSYYDRTPLSTDERPYMKNSLFAGYDLVPIMERHNALLNVRQTLGERVTWSTDALYSTRDTPYDYVASNGTVPVTIDARSKAYGGSTSVQIDIGSSWQADVGGSYNRSISKYRSVQNFSSVSAVEMMSDVGSVDVKLDGSAFEAPGGAAKLAVGAQYRRDGFDSFGPIYNTAGKDTRNVKGVFGELFVPLVGARNARSGVQRLELSLAGRAEEYSDTGSTSNPKVGVLWAPVKSVSLRGTYGTSYRAPQLYEMSESASAPRAFTYIMYNNAGVRNLNTLVIYGNNSNLKPEEAKMWTAGIDIDPEVLGGMKVGFTYFSVDYTDRISQAVADGDFFYALTKPAEYASVTQLNPSPADIANWTSRPNFLNLSNIPLNSIIAIIDQRLTNVSGVEESGLDIDLSYPLQTGVGVFDLKIGGTYLFERLHQVTPTAPAIETLNNVFYPADLKLRNSIGWSKGGFGTTLFVNYVKGYEDRRPSAVLGATVSSWTTMDLSLRYDTPATAGRFLGGLALGLSAQNLFDRDPPYVAQGIGVNMDPTNASAVGRYLSLTVAKHW